MKVTYNKSLKCTILKQIECTPGNAVLRADISHLSGKRQISRVLAVLVKEGKLIRLAYGVYAKTFRSRYTNKVIIQGGFYDVVREALMRLNVDWEPCQAEKDYNANLSQQVPAKLSVKINNRFSRKFGYNDLVMQYE